MPRAAVRGAGALGGVGPTGPRTARQPTDAAGGVGCRSTHRCRGRHSSAKDMGGARAWRHPLLPSCASGPDGCGAVGAWQDLRAVHDSRGACSEKGPFAARSSRSVFPDGCLQGFSDAWRAYLAKTSSFRMHGGDILPRTGAFPARGSFGNAWGEKTATVDCPGIRHGEMLPRIAALGARHGDILLSAKAQERIGAISCRCRTLGERISRAFCHRRAPGNAPRRYLAKAGRPSNAPCPRPNAPRLPLGSSSNATPCAAAPSLHAPPAALFPPLKSKLQVTGVDVVERTTSFGLSAIFGLTYSPHQRARKRGGTVCA